MPQRPSPAHRLSTQQGRLQHASPSTHTRVRSAPARPRPRAPARRRPQLGAPEMQPPGRPPGDALRAEHALRGRPPTGSRRDPRPAPAGEGPAPRPARGRPLPQNSRPDHLERPPRRPAPATSPGTPPRRLHSPGRPPGLGLADRRPSPAAQTSRREPAPGAHRLAGQPPPATSQAHHADDRNRLLDNARGLLSHNCHPSTRSLAASPAGRAPAGSHHRREHRRSPLVQGRPNPGRVRPA